MDGGLRRHDGVGGFVVDEGVDGRVERDHDGASGRMRLGERWLKAPRFFARGDGFRSTVSGAIRFGSGLLRRFAFRNGGVRRFIGGLREGRNPPYGVERGVRLKEGAAAALRRAMYQTLQAMMRPKMP